MKPIRLVLLTACAALIAAGTALAAGSSHAKDTVTVRLRKGTAREHKTAPQKAGFTLRRSGTDLSKVLVVSVRFEGTARAGQDYKAPADTFTFAPGEGTLTIVITPIDDDEVEGVETVDISLVDNGTYAVGDPSTQTIKIDDDDGDADAGAAGLN